MDETKGSKLPKNVKQVGQAPAGQKVYLEDYVVTYLKQMLVEEKKMKTSILYGHKEIIEDELYWFVSGAIEAETDFFMEKTIINEETWQKVNALSGRYFENMTVLGWAMAGPEPEADLQEQILRTQKTYFRPDQKLFFVYLTDEKQENLYLYEKGKMKLQSGYYIYYDKNECMQNYMVSLRAAERHPEEFEADHALRHIRENREEKKIQRNRRKTTALVTCFGMILVTTIMIIGITMLNNYEKMQSMEKVLYQISGKIDERDSGDDTLQTAAAPADTYAETVLAENAQGLSESETVGVGQAVSEDPAKEEQLTGGVANEQVALEQETGQPEMTGDGSKQENVDTVGDTGLEEEQAADNAETPEKSAGDAITDDETDGEESRSDPEAGETAEQDTKQEEAAATDEVEKDDTTQEDTSQEDALQEDALQDAPEKVETIRQETQTSYVIQKGDTLAGICMKYYGNLSRIDEICSINGIENRDNIFYGQKITLP